MIKIILIATLLTPVQYREFFRGLMRPDTGSSCCDESDCRMTDAKLTPDGWMALNQQGNWVLVPNDKIVRGKHNPTGRPIICWLPTQGVICFVEPPMI